MSFSWKGWRTVKIVPLPGSVVLPLIRFTAAEMWPLVSDALAAASEVVALSRTVMKSSSFFRWMAFWASAPILPIVFFDSRR
jgi:hypothetical protein